MATFRNGAYDAIVEALIAQRTAQGITLRKVASLLPDWLGFDFSTLHKIEKKRRDVSFVEVQELAKVLGATVAELDVHSAAIAAARSNNMQRAAPKRKAKQKVLGTRIRGGG